MLTPIAIRVLSDNSVGKRKLQTNRFYYFLDGFMIQDDGIIHIESMRLQEDKLYNDYFIGNTTYPSVSVSAIVGENGSGKSSVIEFYIRLINNFAAATIGEYEVNPGAEHLHFIDGIKGELYYMLNTTPYRLKVENRNVTLREYSKKGYIDNKIVVYKSDITEVLYNNELSAIPLEKSDLQPIKNYRFQKIENKQIQKTIADLYKHFFYTFVSNFSSYAYNTNDFENECNSDPYEGLIRKKKQIYTTEQKNWLNGIFHKNDGYQTPIVLTPFRNEGNININIENLLAKERLLSLIITPNSQFRIINDHLEITGFKIHINNKKYDIKYLKQNVGFSRLQKRGFDNLRKYIVSYWSDCLSIDLSQYTNRKFYDEAIGYLVCKTLKIAKTYKQYNDFYRKYNNIAYKIKNDELRNLVNNLYLDKSHITKKIRQVLAYLIYGIYDDITNKNSFVSIYNIQDKIREKFSKESLFINSIENLVPPPIFDIDICLRNIETNDNVLFRTLSSGERQQVYSISSLLYHLYNINSVWFDTNGHRVMYEHINIIFEEIELYFHPELQRTYIKRLFDGIKQIDISNIKSLNICFVTHSPFVLSDIPARNILALKKDIEDTSKITLSTFGANIHEMLKNSFFLNNGSIGEYASWIIKQIITELDIIVSKKNGYTTLCQQYTEIHNKIMLIDEPIIRNVLLNEFYKAFPTKDIDLKIAELKKQIEELENSK